MKKLYILLSALILSSVAPLFASYCTHCGKNLPDMANFCPKCGYAVYNENENADSSSCIPVYNNNNVTTTNTKVVYSDGVTTTSTVKTISTYTTNANTQIIYKNEYYCPPPVTKTIVAEEGSCDPLLGLLIWGIIHKNHHHHHHHRHVAPPPARHMPPPTRHHTSSYPGVRRVGFLH